MPASIKAFVTEDGRVAEGFLPLGGATAEPGMDVGAIASHEDAERAAAHASVLWSTGNRARRTTSRRRSLCTWEGAETFQVLTFTLPAC